MPPTVAERTVMPPASLLHDVTASTSMGLLGPPVTIVLVDQCLTTQEAAEQLGISRPTLIIDALHAEINRVRGDADFQSRVKRLAERDRQILDRLAR